MKCLLAAAAIAALSVAGAAHASGAPSGTGPMAPGYGYDAAGFGGHHPPVPFTPETVVIGLPYRQAFRVVVGPNLVPRLQARQAAASAAAVYCADRFGSTRVTITPPRLHAAAVLDAWEFGGRCR